MSLARRAFLRIAGGAAAAGPTLARAAVNDVMANQAGAALGRAFAPTPQLPQLAEEPPDMKLLNKLLRVRSRRGEQLIAYRDGHFDGDIAALRSLPHATKVRMQVARDEAFKAESESLSVRLYELQRQFWGGDAAAGQEAAASRRLL